jgi:microcystin-dependent protein
VSDQFVAEIRIVGFNFAPSGWALCNGQILPIAQNAALFSLVGTNYGGNGTSNFGLPNLQGAFPMGQGQAPDLSSRVIGESGGSAAVTLLPTQIPSHSHSVLASDGSGSAADSPSGNYLSGDVSLPYAPNNSVSTGALTPMANGAILSTGGNVPHNNLPPYLCLNFCIALQGIFPPRP